MGAIYKGPIATQCKVYRTTKSWQAGRGWVWTEIQEGTPDAVLNALAQYQALTGYTEISIIPDPNGVLDRIEAVWAEDVTESTWEVKPVEVEADMLLYAHLNGRLTDEQINNIKKAYAQYESRDLGAAPESISTDARAMEYYRLMQRGEKYRTRNTVAVTLQELNSSRLNLWVSTQQVDKVLLTDAQSATLGVSYSFGTFEGMPTDFSSGLPNDTTSVTQPTLVYGWLKSYPTLTRAPWGKWQRNQQWTYGLWSTEVFDTYPVISKPT